MGTESSLFFPAARVQLAGPGGSSQESGPFYVKVSQRAALEGYWFVSVFPTGYRTGTIKYGGQKAAVALIDADLDGRYNGVYGAGGGTDVLIVDINGDGEISSYGQFDGETAPLGRLFHDGKRYWAVTAAEDGTSIAIEPTEPEMGTLKTSAPEAFMALWSDAGFHALWGNGGSWQVPAGKYRPVQVGLQDRNRSGAWRLTAEDAGKLQAVALEPGGNAEVAFGPPLKMQVAVSYQKGRGSVSCEVVGRAGEKYPVGAEKNGKVRPAPKIEILAESGRKLATGRFEYG